jgi:rubredoxin-NAD+ reductase
VVAAANSDTTGSWVAEDSHNSGVWRYLDHSGAQRGFVLTGKHTARRMELSKATVL